jgi:hypothetical protein
MRDYCTENDLERERLFKMLDRLRLTDLQRTLPNGWTVAVLLTHLAFWDRYTAAMIVEWDVKGFYAPATQYEALNVAVEKMSHTIPPAMLAGWVRECAEQADEAAADARSALIATIEAAGEMDSLRRWVHRRHHLDQLEALLGAA